MRRTALLPLIAAALPLLLVPSSPASAAAYADTAAVETASPALVSPRPGVVEVYTRSSTGALVRQVRDDAGRWSTAQSLGGALTSAPATVSSTAGRTDVFARGSRGQLVQRYAVDGVWSRWRDLGGSFTGAPAVTSWAAGRLDVLVRGDDGALRQKYFSAGRWSPWRSLGGALASAPSAVAMRAGRLDVLVRGTDGQLQHRYYVGAGLWSPWSRLGGTLHSQPTAVTTGDGRLDVFLRGGDGELRQKSYVRGAGWGPYVRLAGPVASGAGAVVEADGSLLLAARDTGGRQVVRSRPVGGAWTAWSALDGLRVFRGLGAWVDVFDYESTSTPLPMAASLDDLRARGVRTLYLQTSRFSAAYDLAPSAGRWVDAAHARGLAVVGWYLPGYGDLARDLRRTTAIAAHVTPAGGRFDAVGIDMEAHSGWGTGNEVPRTTMNTRAVEHLRSVRARTSAPLAAITPQPTATDGAGETWEGFPFAAVGASSDLVLPMSYWPRTCHDACVRDYTATNARYAAAWSGKPVHVAVAATPRPTGRR